jgi:hypothetical protein
LSRKVIVSLVDLRNADGGDTSSSAMPQWSPESVIDFMDSQQIDRNPIAAPFEHR